MLKSIFLLLVIPLLAFSQSQVTNDEISKKLDLILQKVSDLEQRVVKLGDPQVLKSGRKFRMWPSLLRRPKNPSSPFPRNLNKRNHFFKAWAISSKHNKPSNPAPGQKRLPGVECAKIFPSLQVRKLLGNPTKIKKSINPRIDQLFIYSGDLDADGGEDQGIVSFYRNRVVNFESPFE